MNTPVKLNLPTALIAFLALAVCSCNTKPKDSSPSQYTTKKAWDGIAPDFRTGDVSPNGKYFTDINWETGNLEIIDLETDTIYPLEGNGYNEGGYSWMSLFSNRGDQLAYEWYNYQEDAHELRLYSMSSKESRILKAASDETYYLEPLEWKKEDDSLLIAKYKEGSNWEMGFISADDGGYRVVVELNWNAPGGNNPFSYPYAVMSSDNSFIGFDYRLESSKSTDLFVVSAATGALSPLWEGEGNDRFLFWDDNDDYIYFYSDRLGIPAIWKLAVSKGKATGEPLLIQENVTGLTAIGKTDKGFAFGKRTGDFNTYYGAMDLDSGELLEDPVMVDSMSIYRNNVGTWSRDGDSLMYVQFKSMPGARESLVIRSIKDHKEREIMFPWYFHNKIGTVAWTSNSAVIVDGGSSDHIGLHTFDLKSGEITAAFDHGDKGFFQRFKTNRTGSEFFIEMRRHQPGIVSMDPETNSSTRLLDGAVVAASTCVSPDDRFLAFLRNNPQNGKTTIEILDLENKDLRILTSHDQGILSNPLVWASDGNSLVVGVNLSESEKGLWSVSLDDPSNPIFIDLPDAVNNTLVLSPDGRHFAYQGGTIRGELFYLTSE